MSSTTKLKMNYRKFNTIWTTVVAVLVVVAIAATVVMNFFSLSMEAWSTGRGTRSGDVQCRHGLLRVECRLHGRTE